MFNINTAALPTLRTRQALLILDLQNEFVSPDGALTINQPDALVSRTVQLAKAFRLSGAGDVIWIRTRFDGHRPLSGGADGGDQIITTDAPVVPRRTTSQRGRQPTSGRHEEAVMEADAEAFLSYPPGCEKPPCVRPGSDGAQLAAQVQQAVDASRDIQFTKTHYSAFAGSGGQQLVQLLRGRFVTEIYVCGALTNISIYATALDAGRHGYDITLVDDCCGYRSDMRHSNAVHRLVQLTGCEVATSGDVMAKLKPERPSSEEKARRRSRIMDTAPQGSSGSGNSRASGRNAATAHSGSRSKEAPLAVGQSPNKDGDDGLPSSFEKLTLSGASPSAAPAVPPATAGAEPQHQPHGQNTSQAARQSVPPVVTQKDTNTPVSTTTSTSTKHRVKYVDSAPLEVDPDLGSDPGADDSPTKRREPMDFAQKLSYLRSNQVRGPPRILIPPNSSLASATRAAAAAKAKVRSRQPRADTTTSKTTASPAKNIQNSPSKDTNPASSSQDKQPASPEMDSQPVPQVSSPLCEGDTHIITSLLPPTLSSTAFPLLKTEVSWLRMSHQGGEVPRLVAVQGEVDPLDGSHPAYRHPSDESPPLLPFTPTVAEIKAHVEKQVGHPLNHVLIQLYRDGTDYISEHSDKTLDIVRGSYVANVSLGAERTMVFRTKRQKTRPTSPISDKGKGSEAGPARHTVRAQLPHNSLCRMGLATNARWLHSIRQDKRIPKEKSEAELAYGGERISLTFRQIGTFLDATQQHIWGQGATSKTKDGVRPVVNGQTEEAVRMLRAFGTENHASEFDWEGSYGEGFDVLNISVSPRVYFSKDGVVNMRVAIMLGELGVGFAKGSTGAEGVGGEAVVRFVDNDAGRTSVEGGMAVLLYLEGVYGGKEEVGRGKVARRVMRFQGALGLGERWRLLGEGSEGEGMRKFLKEMEVWEGYAREVEEGRYIAGGERMSIADFALWPVLHDIVVTTPEMMSQYKNLTAYYERLKSSKGGLKALEGEKRAEAAPLTDGTEK